MEDVLKKDSWTSLRGGANGGKVGERVETLEDHPGTTWSDNTGAELTQSDVYYHYYEQKTENNDLKPGYVFHSILGGLSLFQEKKSLETTEKYQRKLLLKLAGEIKAK